MHPLLSALCVCALLFVLPAHAAEDPLTKGQDDHVAQVLGWSADEKRFALRLYVHVPLTSDQVGKETAFCEGYDDPEGNPLRGGVFVLAYEGSRRLALFPIQDLGPCTPLEEAQNRLTEAMKQLGTLGIRLDKPGKEVVVPPASMSLEVTEGLQAPYTLQYAEHSQSQKRDAKSGLQRGSVQQEVSVKKAGTARKVIARKTSYEYAPAMAGYWRANLDRVFLSPSGKTLVVLGHERVGNMRGSRKSLRLLGVLSWAGDTLKPL